MKRRVVLGVSVVLAALALFGGIALAATLDGTNRDDRLIGNEPR